MNKSTRTLLDKVQKFLYGELSLYKKDIEFLLALEDKILNMKGPEDNLYWYCDYNDRGNLYEFWKTFEYTNEWGRKAYPRASVSNKSGIHIKKTSDSTIVLETKEGYGANWESYTAYLNAKV